MQKKKAAWLILFIGACVAGFHGVAWWIIIFELVFVVGTIVLLGVNKFYRFSKMVLDKCIPIKIIQTKKKLLLGLCTHGRQSCLFDISLSIHLG